MLEEAKLLFKAYSILAIMVLVLKNVRHFSKKDAFKRTLEVAALIPIFIYLTNID